MNLKKIIPLSLATMSVIGAFTACSDDQTGGVIVGADEHPNTMAELSSSSEQSSSSVVIESSSSNPFNFDNMPESAKGAVLALLRSNNGTAATVSHVFGEQLFDDDGEVLYDFEYPIDSVNAHETFNKAVQAIYDGGGTIRLLDEDPVYHSLPDCQIDNYFSLDDEARKRAIHENANCVTTYEYFLDFEQNNRTFVFMKDEAGVFHGPLLSERGYLGYPENGRNIECLNGYDVELLYDVHFGNRDLSSYHKWLFTEDSTMIEEFKKDCASENGEFKVYGYAHYCNFHYELTSDSVFTYSDPYWEKYAKHIVEKCVSTVGNEIGDYYFEN